MCVPVCVCVCVPVPLCACGRRRGRVHPTTPPTTHTHNPTTQPLNQFNPPCQVSSPDGAVTVTNDGATILKAVHIDNPAAKVLVDIAKTQVGGVPSLAPWARRHVCCVGVWGCVDVGV